MKIAIFSESFFPRVNGVANSVLRVSRFLQANGHEVLIVAPGFPASVNSDIDINRLNVKRIRYISLPKVADFEVGASSVAKLENILRDFNPDVVHLASPFALGMQGCRAARNLGIPVVAVYQTDVSGFAGFYGLPKIAKFARKWSNQIHRMSTINLVPSSSTMNEFVKFGAPNVRLWGRGVDTELFSPDKRSQQIRDSWLTNGRTIVGYLGRLAPEKQIDRLSSLDENEHKVIIIGDGPIRSELEKKLPNATFTGQLSGQELATTLASLDVLISTGEHETFCQVIQEAMAAGIPVIAPRAGGPIDLVIEGVTGFLYEPGSTKSMLNRLRILHENEKLRKQFGFQATQIVKGRTWEAICQELVGHYQDAIGASMQKVA
ncbi:MAG: glycosyltransferase family 1 protein [Actinobacteria bacterium]|nr:glycosyltransferase family 1 protein [Actinomycetota bacterium]